MKKKILIVDDEESFTKLLKLSLEKTGDYEVYEENDPTNVLDLARSCQPDVLLVDLIMPQTDGYELAKSLRDIPSMSQLPIIFLTAVMETQLPEETSEDIRKLPHLHKPATTQEVIDCIEAYFTKG